MLRTSYSVLSTIAASAADIVTAGGYFSITGVPRIKYSQVNNAGFGYVLKATEYVGSITTTPTVSVGVPNTLVITQFVGSLGKTVSEVVSYTPITGDTATIVCNAWRAQLALYSDLKVAGTGTATFIVTATATTVANSYRAAIINVTSTSGTNSVAVTAADTGAVSAATNATPVVITVAAGTYVVGQVVTSAGQATNTAANGTFLITATNGTTTVTLGNIYTGADIAGNGATGTGTLTHGSFGVAASPSTTNVSAGNQSRGAYWDLVAAGVDATLLTSGKTYNQTIFQYYTREGGALVETAISQHTLYVQDDATNFANFATRMGTLLADYAVGGTTADPINLALV